MMTEVTFYTNVTNQIHLISKLLHKAQTTRRKLHISVQDEGHRQSITSDIYRIDPTSFFGINPPASESMHDLTSAIISHTRNYFHKDIIVNLTLEVPDNFSSFKRLIEIVQQDKQHVELARARYRWYKDRGYSITTHKLQSQRVSSQ
jgi:DNA polymerase-3 subunit chi